MSTINVGKVSYNPATGSYQARVDVNRGGTTFRYPCEVSGPLDMNISAVEQQLRHAALRMSDTRSDLLSSI